jgi:oligopeptide transport system substrate-binding protein
VHYNSLKVADFQVARAAWIADYNDPENFLFLMASSTGQLNYSRYVNPAYDALLRRAAVTLDLAERADILRQAEAIAMQDLPVAPIYFYVSRNLVHTWVKGWHANVNDVYLSRYLRIEGRP